MKILRTWKKCCDAEINALYSAVKGVAEQLYPQYFYGCEYYFFINSSKKCLGKCVYDYNTETLIRSHGKMIADRIRNKSVVILLSRYVTEKKDVLRTLIHEFAHAVAPSGGHSAEWKVKAAAIGEKFGEVGFKSHCTKSEQLRFNGNSGVKQGDFKYAVLCEKCGRVAKREKMCKLIAHPEKYRCAYCGGKFKRVR